MLKVVVFDGGYGGEFFADQLEEALLVLDVVRVIDWRNADKLLTGPRSARKVAKNALKPYIGKVDLIVFANHLLAATSLRHFRRKYKNQKFIGLGLKRPDTFIKRDVLILTTKAVARSISYHNFLFQIKRRSKTLTLDHWPLEIDNGDLTEDKIRATLGKLLKREKFKPQEIILACSQFNDIKTELRNIFGHNLKIHDSFDDTVRNVCKVLCIRGGVGKKP